MSFQHHIEELKINGYTVIKGVLNADEVNEGRRLFAEWFDNNQIDKRNSIHGIIKHYQVGHSQFAWYTRTRPAVIKVFEELWQTNQLMVSFDGCCYIKPTGKTRTRNDWWMHVDQATTDSSFKCVQGFVSYSDNNQSGLKVYRQSHLLHKLLPEFGLVTGKNWCRIPVDWRDKLGNNDVIIPCNKGDLVLWDSRLFHQNHLSPTEERLVQYVCYLPTTNSEPIRVKRRKYFNDRRTTSHWPYPISVNGLQPQTFGDESRLVDYEKVWTGNLEPYLETINKLI